MSFNFTLLGLSLGLLAIALGTAMKAMKKETYAKSVHPFLWFFLFPTGAIIHFSGIVEDTEEAAL